MAQDMFDLLYSIWTFSIDKDVAGIPAFIIAILTGILVYYMVFRATLGEHFTKKEAVKSNLLATGFAIFAGLIAYYEALLIIMYFAPILLILSAILIAVAFSTTKFTEDGIVF
jgi:uncharacterized membrane protein